MEINRRYFEGQMHDHGLSLRGLAKRMDMGHSQLSLAFSGARKLQLDEAAKMSVIFGEPLHRIVENAGVSVRPASGRRVSVVGAVNGDGTVLRHAPGVIERTNAPEDLPDNVVALQCRTTGSGLDWLDGAVMFCRSHGPAVDPGVMGRLCHAKIAGGPEVVACVRRGYRDGTYNLSGMVEQTNVALEWATPILVTRH